MSDIIYSLLVKGRGGGGHFKFFKFGIKSFLTPSAKNVKKIFYGKKRFPKRNKKNGMAVTVNRNRKREREIIRQT